MPPSVCSITRKTSEYATNVVTAGKKWISRNPVRKRNHELFKMLAKPVASTIINGTCTSNTRPALPRPFQTSSSVNSR